MLREFSNAELILLQNVQKKSTEYEIIDGNFFNHVER